MDDVVKSELQTDFNWYLVYMNDEKTRKSRLVWDESNNVSLFFIENDGIQKNTFF